MNEDQLDEMLLELDQWIPRAGQAILSLYDDSSKYCFSLSNLPKDEPQSDFEDSEQRRTPYQYRTTTSRAFTSICEYARWIDEESPADPRQSATWRAQFGKIVTIINN